ncbi:pentatricopeptide repeat-containing protein At5g15280, mitochondrial [Diospyros lotus]|uniref:pentatricopeptide repeat-containing protein At5g15280, mitochondrial n=1 Tax=Diospyros lotus TaxID=55363 RepID=UPI00224D7BF3|nr:pentatricopeptide repeat-containing protein At5g15280, mitochondrial [Diospyros lotus]
MRARSTATTVSLCNRMVPPLSGLLPKKKLHSKQVGSLFPGERQFYAIYLLEPPSSPASSLSSTSASVDLSSINPCGIAKSVSLRCSHLWSKDGGDGPSNLSLKDLLLKLSTISPETTRKFRRVSDLKPENVLEILLGFQFECKQFETEVQKVQSLWGIFKWASDQGRDFEHLPRSFEVMGAMLVRVRLFREVEFLLSTMDSKGIPLDSDEVFSNLIQGYVAAGEAQKAISIYDRARSIGLVPSMSSYRVFLDFLVRNDETQLAFRVYVDMVETGMELGVAERAIFENLIQLLCGNGKVQEARNVVRNAMALGIKPSNTVLDAIAGGYSEKKDYDDLVKFFVETECVPDVVVGNKIIFSLCSSFGTDRARLFLEELENLGFGPDEITFGILIGWSSREGKLKNAFFYLSEMLSRCLKPGVWSYNALISSVFREGMWKHARDIFLEMNDRGVTPNWETFRVLLAGFTGARQLDEVKSLVCKMVELGLVQLSSVEDPLLKAFVLLGLDPLSVKVRRDNGSRLYKAEFFDDLGNGLYLETDLPTYERTMGKVLEDSLIPDFNSFILKDYNQSSRNLMVMVEEMGRWGQELSLTAFSVLVKGLCASSHSMRTVVSLVEKMPKLTNQLDQETLNMLVQALSRKGFSENARIIFRGMLQRGSYINSETYTALITGFCRKRNFEGLLSCWKLAHLDKWLPELKDCNIIMGCLCQQGLLEEALDIFENMLAGYPCSRLNICHDFLEELSSTGFTNTALVLVEELQKKGFVLDYIAYSHLIKGFFMEKMSSKAFTMLDILLENKKMPCLDVTVLSIYHLCRASKFEKAVALKEISLREGSSTSPSVHCALMRGFCKSGMVWEAVNIFQNMSVIGLPPDSETCNMLVQEYCQINNFKKVWELLGIIIRKKFSISISSYRNLVCLLCTRSMVPSALNVKELLLKEINPPYIVIYNILIFYLLRTKNSSFMDELLDEFQGKGLQLDGVTYNFLVHGYSQCKELSHSVHYLTTMMRVEHRPSNRSLRTIISCLCAGEKLGKALELSREMESRGWTHDSVVQNAIAEGLLARGKIQEAVSFLERMEEKVLVPDNINYDNLIKQFCRLGREDKAVDLLNIMLKKGSILSSSSYDYLIQHSCSRHRLEQALDLLTEMMDRNLKPSIMTWNAVLQKVCQNGRVSDAEGLLKVMVQVGETPTREMYYSVIHRYYNEGNLQKASGLLQIMQQHGYEPDFQTHWSLISNLKNSSSNKNSGNNSRPFLSTLLSESGFAQKNYRKVKPH